MVVCAALGICFSSASGWPATEGRLAVVGGPTLRRGHVIAEVFVYPWRC